MTLVMHAVTAWHKNNCWSGSEHVLATNWTVALQIPLNTLVPSFQTNCHAHVTSLTMKVINAKTLSNPTDTTVIAVIDVLLWVIVPELTIFAIVLWDLLAAVDAILSSRLHLEAMHTHHCRNKVSVGEIRHIPSENTAMFYLVIVWSDSSSWQKRHGYHFPQQCACNFVDLW